MKFSSMILPAAALTMLFAACQDEDFGYKTQDVKNAKYDRQFAEAFGEIDPEQDWSMAALVTANLEISGATAYVYTEKPGHKGSELAGIVTGSKAQFNLVKGAKQVYVMVEQGDQYVVNGYFNVIDNVININNNPVSKATSITRAGSDETYSVGAKLFTQTAYAKDVDWDGKSYITGDGKLFYIEKDGEDWWLWYAPNAGDPFRKLNHNAQDPNNNLGGYHNNGADAYYADDNTLALSNYYWPGLLKMEDGNLTFNYATKYTTRQSWDATYYKISGNTQTEDVEWLIGDCANLFWIGDAVFHEGQNYKTTDHKLAAYAKYNTTVEEMEQGVVVVTTKENARVDIPFMFGATDNDNIFGYYYYTNDEDALTANRYVLYEDAQPSSNIKVNGTAVGDMSMAAQQSGWDRDSKVVCTSRHLVYFGEDGKSAGTLDFPKGVKIGFFIMRQHNSYSGFDKAAGQQRTVAETGWAYSDPNLNLKYLIDANGGENNTNWTYSNGTADKTRGSVRALSWTYDGRLLCGFGDQSNDYDLNDFVWWVDGDVTNSTKIRITTQASSSWIVACEDLGGTFDYDFNDLVFALRKTQIKEDKTKATLELIPLAAGGTLNAQLVYGSDVKGEIHDLIQPGANYDEPLNVDAGTTPTEGPALLVAEEIDWNADINDIIQRNVKVLVVQKEGEEAVDQNYFITAYDKENKKKDSAPQMLILPSGWDWPAEEVPIKDVYAGFGTWASDASAVTWCTEKNGEKATQFVNNPLPKAQIIVNQDQEIVVDPVVPGTDDLLKPWNIDFTESVALLYVGDVKTYSVKTSGTDYGPTGSLYSYEVGDASILAIDAVGHGTVTLNPKKVGHTTLSVTYDDKHDLNHKPTTKIFEIEVKMPDLPYAQFSVPETLTVGVGGTVQFGLTITDETKIDKGQLSYSIEQDDEYIEVPSNGWGGGYNLTTIKGLKVGTAKFVIKHAFTAGKFLETTHTINVTVTKPIPAFTLKANGAEVSTLTLYTGDTFNFTIDGADGPYTCSSSNGSAASVALSGKTGTITANAPGTTTIKVTYPEDDDHAEASQTIEVTVKDVSVEKRTITEKTSVDMGGWTQDGCIIVELSDADWVNPISITVNVSGAGSGYWFKNNSDYNKVFGKEEAVPSKEKHLIIVPNGGASLDQAVVTIKKEGNSVDFDPEGGQDF